MTVIFSSKVLQGQTVKLNTQYLFSPTGDTVLAFGGGFNDSLVFNIFKGLNDTIMHLDNFTIKKTKENYSRQDYPSDIINKYNLRVEGNLISLDSCRDIKVTQKLISNRKLYVSAENGEQNIYKKIISTTITTCNKTLLEKFKVQKQYAAETLDNSSDLDNTTFTLIKMQNKNIYLLWARISETYYPDNKEDFKTIKTNFFQVYLIKCH